ncbi:LOW QUALITY PROTEIN: another transcription unit protein [Drosophila eugracilis]|uniref:LOW QUALITY PROTEIN: another transcription unit protein n=1 Tax=Drosophila eugracilis TaxID=29029 RepID=UPI001BDA67E4|nr:LOW QUALITY PROTEIN: another transcription unit protein [Drosophila eugracilis]
MSELEFSSSDDPSLNGGSGNNSEDEKSVSSAENKSSNSEFTYNSREGITKVIKPVPSIDDHYRKIFGNELTVKFNATIPAESFGILEGPSQFLRMPHFIPVESKAYNALSLENLITPEDLKDEQSRNDFISRLKTTVRWREGPNKGMESNSRIVRWSDGSETFHVGGEVFDVMHHPVTDDHNHLYVRLDSLYQSHGTIKDKMTLRPKLDSNFGQRHVQGLRNRAMNKPQTGCVKVLMDMGANPVQDRERRAKEEMANLRKEEREKRREFQLNRRKPRVQPIYHCTADDTDVEPPRSDTESVVMPNNTQGITPQNQQLGDEKVDNGGDIGESNEEDDSIDMSEDDDDLLDEPSCSNSKIKKVNGSDSDESIQISNIYRKPKQLIYSDSD